MSRLFLVLIVPVVLLVVACGSEETAEEPPTKETTEEQVTEVATDRQRQEDRERTGRVVVAMIEEKNPLPKSGGPAIGSVLLPAALLASSGIVAYIVMRRSL